MIIGAGFQDRHLGKDEIRKFVWEGLDSLAVEGKRVLVLIPDSTRTMPTALLFDLLEESLARRVRQLDYLVALGTHRLMDEDQLSRLVGRQVRNGMVGDTHVFNHEWHEPMSFTQVGMLSKDEVSQISGGLLSTEVPVRLNKLILGYDQIIICGPVFPHEVVGFSGGNKYFFPGIAGPEIINFTHWLGALITNWKIIGTVSTPVREVIERAAEFVPVPTACFSLVVTPGGMSGLYFGPTREAWQAAASLSAKVHVISMQKPFERVLSIMPEMYDDLWTAAKGMYKLEPIVQDGGEVIIYAPHIREVSHTHGRMIDEIGYHCRDYFLSQWDKYKDYPGGVLAHSTHLTGLGTYDPATGYEFTRIRVTLATSIPEERCRRINLGYIRPESISPEEWKDREEEGILVVPHAGEMLYRLGE